MRDYQKFISAYKEFRRSVDFHRKGFLPELDKLIWYMIEGVPPVPADEYDMPDAREVAIDQRIAILKALFVEINKDEPDEFLDEGLILYDKAARLAKELLRVEMADDLAKFLERCGISEGSSFDEPIF